MRLDKRRYISHKNGKNQSYGVKLLKFAHNKNAESKNW